MVDINSDKLLTINEAAEHCRVTPKTVRVWARTGDRDGRLLETVKIGGKRLTSLQAIQRFTRQSVSPVPPADAGEVQSYSDNYQVAMQRVAEQHGGF